MTRSYAPATRIAPGDVRDAAYGDVSGGAALDDSETTVDLSAVAEALGGHLSPAENSLGEEAAALRGGHMKPESFIVNDDDSSILQEGGGVGDDSEWREDVVALSSFSSLFRRHSGLVTGGHRRKFDRSTKYGCIIVTRCQVY
jgi:hypothetical protein